MLHAALGAGVEPVAIKEELYQATAYLGIGRTHDFLLAANEVLAQHGVALPLAPQATTGEATRFEQGLAKQVALFGPAMAERQTSCPPLRRNVNRWLAANCFGDYYPRAALQSWQATQRNAHVIGDFVWTAWDYLGEVGIGRWQVTDEDRPEAAGYPWLLANCSDLDLLGQKRPQSYYRDFVWKRGTAPRLFCLPPELVGKHIARLSWGWLPVQRSYTFAGWEGQPVEVHVYADAAEVELLQNGVSMGRLPCTEEQEYTAVFTVPYRPGKLEAVAYAGGVETGRDCLTTAGPTAALVLQADRAQIAADGDDLAFVTIRAVDEAGTPVFHEGGTIHVNVLGGGQLLALGSADPKPDHPTPYTGTSCPLFEGSAMAVLRSEPGAKGCLLEVTLGEGEHAIKAQLTIGFAAVEMPAAPVHDVLPSLLDKPLGALMENPAALAVLRQHLVAIVDSPMVSAMKGMSLKKLFAMSGAPAPAGLEKALAEALGG